ncbi:Transpeptidase domain-containing protein [Sulfidibacter corallicola]|uniref:beta-lactamase n=1 Tax=Sulfidibacter corallicola TaxID=2818388 RepID=A0A8A4TEX6_SULCO|nr:penicillin-binding transpeptidase domain-containing protein [Sulfidibacter corallicola]QTD48097.1 hypothetical protein J3U87_21135 [Sulfidibacter corallicola]
MVLRRRIGYSRRGYGNESRRGLRFLILALVIAGIGYFSYRKFIQINLVKANEALAVDNLDEARTYFQRVSGLPFSKGLGQDGLGVIDLLHEDLESARSHFKIVLEKKPSGTGGDPALILEKFYTRGAYERGRIYRDFLLSWKEADQLSDYYLLFSALSLGNRNIREARSYLDKTPQKLKETPRFAKLSELIHHYEKEDEIPVWVDRNGNPILNYQVTEESYAFDSPKLFAGWGDPNGEASPIADLSTDERLSLIKSTLDLNLQKAAFQAMKGYNGTMVMLQPDTGEVLAAYGSEGLDPLTTTFEPGSVIKVLTYGIFLEEDGDVTPFAPKNYPGNMKIGGRLFYDWTTQGDLNSVEEGMAVSCNLMFAQMGIELGWPELSKGFSLLFDDREVPNMLKRATPGRVSHDPENAYELGRIAIGLDSLETTVLGLVKIPAAVANGGKIPTPQMLDSFANLEGQIYREIESSDVTSAFSAATAEKLQASMEAALQEPRGTARRARVDFVKAAMKTGTAGDRPFNSIMVGMFPLNNPKVVFAFYLHKGGKCEINGARVAKSLQEQIRALAPAYLEN